MKVPFEWLKEFVVLRMTPKALADRLTMVGLEVTGIHDVDGAPILDLEITPNRADCLSMIGVAREVAVMTEQPLKLPKRSAPAPRTGAVQPLATRARVAQRPSIHIEDRTGCQRYIGRVLEGVRIAPSPAWMQRRLIACGVRPINNVVDVTNYVLLEYGQPLHAFDFEHIAGGTILVRRARPNERLTTLDGVSRALAQDMLVIADANQAVAIAGIMGGIGSEVTDRTRTLLLESALFDPVTVRRTARKLGLTTESSYRFERGVDPVGVETASQRATELLQELAQGEETVVCDVGQKPLKRTGILIDPERASRWLGTPLSPTLMRTTLAKLSCHVASAGKGPLHVSVPSFRRDLTQAVDLYEELARVAGYERIPSTLPTVSLTIARSEASQSYQRVQSLRWLCASLGLTEAITWSLIAESDLARCGYTSADATRLTNPLSQDHAYLRPSLLMGLLRVVQHNVSQGAAGVQLFEVGSVVSKGTEQLQLGIIVSGVWSRDWRTKDPCDFFRLKGLLTALTERFCHGTLQFVPTRQSWAETGQTTETQMDGKSVGVAGQVAHSIASALDLEQEVWFAELSVDALLEAVHATPFVSSPMKFPPVNRDLSFLVETSASFGSIERAIREVAGALAIRVELIDRYTGSQVPSGKHSLTFSIEYRDSSRTLTAAEVETVHTRIGQTLVRQFGAQLR